MLPGDPERLERSEGDVDMMTMMQAHALILQRILSSSLRESVTGSSLPNERVGITYAAAGQPPVDTRDWSELRVDMARCGVDCSLTFVAEVPPGKPMAWPSKRIRVRCNLPAIDGASAYVAAARLDFMREVARVGAEIAAELDPEVVEAEVGR